eukprot:NODE_3412_length_778_cov_31.212620_g2851_i0.p1 GENE.NODE_3412_length_778_cov_31.212620_g2851_i0~~NODE_3412_length_778_cov_31.212620_g2851_i0.p1  ORF type:complete len:115 (-),score=28.99 NODE_3412_length_778_cov_31.212620_g2851_i0:83-427(-)
MMARTLPFMGIESAAMAPDGFMAIKLLKDMPSTVFVLTDLNMPTMDGFHTAKALRAQALPNQWLFIIAISGSIDSGTPQECKEAGIDALMSKPLKLEVLARAIFRVLEFASPQE